MAIFLDWFASHNTLVIQSLAAIVALLIVVLIFRLLFTNQEATADGVGKNVTYAQLEDKLNKLLEQQSLMKVSVSAATDGAAAVDGLGDDALAALSGDPAAVEAAAQAKEQMAELSRLRVEITTLKDSLKRKEDEIVSAKEQAAQSTNTAQQDAKLTDLSGKITDYEKEIETLKSRLSDYEIIAEDIADLQAYKKENQELKNQLAQSGQAAAPVAAPEPTGEELADSLLEDIAIAEPEITPEPEVVPESTPEPAATEDISAAAENELDALMNEDITEEPVVPDDILTAANDALSDIPTADAEAVETMPEAYPSEELENDEAREVSKDVKKEDKNLLDEFEKHFAKDDED